MNDRAGPATLSLRRAARPTRAGASRVAGASFPSVSFGSAGSRAVRALAAVLFVPGVLGCQGDRRASPTPATPSPPETEAVASVAALLPPPAPGADPLIQQHGEGVSTTADGRILLELRPEDITPANPFDLNRRTVVFTPDGAGGYARTVTALDWKEDWGDPVADGEPVALKDFAFAFGGRGWESFHVSQRGVVTFGQPFEPYDGRDIRFLRAREHVWGLDGPAISPLYKPLNRGHQRVAQWADRVVITWSTIETGDTGFYVAPGVGPRRRAQFQAVLGADGSIRFNYRYVPFADGVVGLFPEVERGEILVRISDDVDPELPGHLDLLEVVIFATNRGAVIVEFETRDPIPEPAAQTVYSYRLLFDFEEPYWAEDDDRDLRWFVNVRPGGDRFFGHGELLPSETDHRITVLAPIWEWAGLPASVIARALQFDDGSFVGADRLDPVKMEFPDPDVDLSQSADSGASAHREIFQHQSAPARTEEMACRVIDVLGDNFDTFWFNTEYRIDLQSPRTTAGPYGPIGGIGRKRNPPPCGEGRLKAVPTYPVWVVQLDERERFEPNLYLLAHEFIHTWSAYVSFIDKDGEREPLSRDACRCHWREELHLPAAFPWGGGFASSIMGGRYWFEHGDGTFEHAYSTGRPGASWLDLYLMGLAAPEEVPDMLLLRNLTPVDEDRPWGPHTADKEVVTIRQILAAEGPREPGMEESQKDFNVGLVYLLEPGERPDRGFLALQGRYRDKVVEHWSHITGGRSRLTTIVEPPAPSLRPR